MEILFQNIQVILTTPFVIYTNGVVLLGLILSTSIAGLILSKYLPQGYFDSIETFILNLSLGIIVFTLVGLFMIVLGIKPNRTITLSLLLAILLIAIYIPPKIKIPNLNGSWKVFIIVSVLISIARFSFITQLYYPPYVDAVKHFSIITNLLSQEKLYENLMLLVNNFEEYYHTGFHIFVAFQCALLNIDPIRAMLVIPQYFLIIIALLFYPLGKQLSKSPAIGWLAVIFAGFGWLMPSYASNWGKYPAIIGLLAFVLLINLALTNREKQNKNIVTLIIIISITATLFHSRTVFLILLLIYLIRFKRLQEIRLTKPIVILLMIFTSILLFSDNSLELDIIIKRYLQTSFFVFAFCFFLTIYFLIKAPQKTYSTFMCVGLLLAYFTLRLIPLFGEKITALDRPFVEMILFIPLTIGALFGITTIQNRKNLSINKLVFFISTITIINSMIFYPLYPNSCCNYVSKNDLNALTWADKNIKNNKFIGISTNQTSGLRTSIEADAGVWLSTRTFFFTKNISSDLDFSIPENFLSLCQNKISYLYAGHMQDSFSQKILNQFPNWYSPVFSDGDVAIYRLNCRKP